MNYDTRDDANDQHVSLNNEGTLDADVFAGAAPTPTAGAASGTGARVASEGGGSLLKTDDVNEDFEEEEDLNREREMITRIFVRDKA